MPSWLADEDTFVADGGRVMGISGSDPVIHALNVKYKIHYSGRFLERQLILTTGEVGHVTGG